MNKNTTSQPEGGTQTIGHTPGPWNRNIKPASKYPTIFAGRNTHVAVVKTQGLTEQEIEANCNLIAAAPELLEAFQKLEKWFNGAEIRKSIGGGEPLKIIQAAIAKATN